MTNKEYDLLLLNMPANLEKAVLRVLSQHVGKGKAIGRSMLTEIIARSLYRVHERQVREVIKALRRQGHLICSAPGEDGGYWLAQNLEEYREFIQTEFLAKIGDMSETVKAMDAAAASKFGKSSQMRLL